ncbi:hypothetical protein JTB14_006695 [Gonioctena quinquepunctata]|nr:hypothetical protein JTB14_006695 [Gonioctena quinquepunctata]
MSQIEIANEPTPSCSSLQKTFSPSKIRPLPKAPPRKTNTNSKSTVLTDTPDKKALQKEYEEEMKKKQKKYDKIKGRDNDANTVNNTPSQSTENTEVERPKEVRTITPPVATPSAKRNRLEITTPEPITPDEKELFAKPTVEQRRKKRIHLQRPKTFISSIIPILPPWSIPKIIVENTLARYDKSQTNHGEIRAEFHHLLEHYADFNLLYTDASKTSDGVGTAFTTAGVQASFKLPTERYSVAALLAILFALPFAWRVLVHREHGHWGHPLPAFYFAHLELFLGNGCLGIGVMMLLALTLERYVSVCHPGHARPILGSPIRAVTLIPLSTFIFYIPTLFRSQVKTCKLLPETILLYQRIEDTEYINHPIYSVYKVVLELIFKVIPVILLAALNLRILVVYRRSCERRRKMTLSRKCSGEEDPRKFAEERRLVLLLGSTSILFLICVTPMVVLNVTLSEANLIKYPYQVRCSIIVDALQIFFQIYKRFSIQYQ